MGNTITLFAYSIACFTPGKDGMKSSFDLFLFHFLSAKVEKCSYQVLAHR